MENNIDLQTNNQKFDLTISDRFITYGDLKIFLDKAIEKKYRAICLPPCFLRWSKKYVGGSIKICQLIDYPLGNATINTKLSEIKEGLKSGADEFEVLINHNELKSGNVDYILTELKQLKRAARSKLLKVVFEPTVLTTNERDTFIKCALSAHVDYIVLGTPFGLKPIFDDIKIIKDKTQKRVKIKYFLNIRDDEDIKSALCLGADRIGVTSF